MTARNLVADIVGVILLVLAVAWAAFDAVQHAGRVGPTTLIGAMALCTIGGWLVSMTKTLAILNFLFTQAKRFATLKFPSAGSDSAE